MIFVDQNSEPRVINHTCIPELVGRKMSGTELNEFALDVLVDFFQSTGYTVSSKKYIPGFAYPKLLLTAPNETIYFIVLLAAAFPNTPALKSPSQDIDQIVRLAHAMKAIPRLAPISFINAGGSQNEMSDLTCGGQFFVSFGGLSSL